MRQREFDYDDVLRRALRSAADLVEPSADGLERIRARLSTPRPAFLAWLIVGYVEAIRPLLGYLEPVAPWLRTTLGPVIERFRPAKPDAAHPQRRYAWLRPAAAMATAVFVVAMGAFALTALPQVIQQSGAFILPIIGGGPGAQGGSPKAFGSASTFSGGSALAGAGPGTRTGQNQRTVGCGPSRHSGPGPATSPSPSSSSPSPSTSTSTSPSTSPSPTTTPSSTSTSPTPTPTGSSTSTAGTTSSPGAPAGSGNTPAATPSAAAGAAAVVPAGSLPGAAAVTPCKPTHTPTRKQISTGPGSGVPAMSHAKARRAR